MKPAAQNSEGTGLSKDLVTVLPLIRRIPSFPKPTAHNTLGSLSYHPTSSEQGEERETEGRRQTALWGVPDHARIPRGK
jgi:hypothetical protein